MNNLHRFLWTVFTSEDGESYTVLQLIYKMLDILKDHEGRIDNLEEEVKKILARLGIIEADIARIWETLRGYDIDAIWNAIHQLENELLGINNSIEQLLQEVV